MVMPFGRSARLGELQYRVRWGGEYYGELTWEPVEHMLNTLAWRGNEGGVKSGWRF